MPRIKILKAQPVRISGNRVTPLKRNPIAPKVYGVFETRGEAEELAHKMQQAGRSVRVESYRVPDYNYIPPRQTDETRYYVQKRVPLLPRDKAALQQMAQLGYPIRMNRHPRSKR